MAFTDGASIDNPGKSGAGVSFFGVNPPSMLKPLDLSDSGSSELSSGDEFEQSRSPQEIDPYDNIEGCTSARLVPLFSC